jgi:uncharacterized protein YoxC
LQTSRAKGKAKCPSIGSRGILISKTHRFFSETTSAVQKSRRHLTPPGKGVHHEVENLHETQLHISFPIQQKGMRVIPILSNIPDYWAKVKDFAPSPRTRTGNHATSMPRNQPNLQILGIESYANL